MARPRPRLAPVIRARRPSSRKVSRTPMSLPHGGRLREKTPPPNPLPEAERGSKPNSIFSSPPLRCGEGVGGRGSRSDGDLFHNENANAENHVAAEGNLVAVLEQLARQRRQLAGLPVPAGALADVLAVDVGAVLAPEILHPHFRRIHAEQAVTPRDILVIVVIRQARVTLVRPPKDVLGWFVKHVFLARQRAL